MDDFLFVLKSAGLLIAGLSVLVTLHELGHFLPAKLFKMRVDKFYLFFDWPRKLFSVKKGETEYGVGMLPLGGYVKIAGMVDESLDKEGASKEPEAWEFRAKPVWQKAIVMVGGVTVNVMLGVAIFAALAFVNGEQRIPVANLQAGMAVSDSSLMAYAGFQDGDIPVSVNGQPITYLDELREGDVLLGTDIVIQVERNGQPVDVNIPNDFVNELSQAQNDGKPISLFQPYIRSVEVGNEHAEGLGLQTGDIILSINDTALAHFTALYEYVDQRPNLPLAMQVLRGADTLELTGATSAEGTIGIKPNIQELKPDTFSYGVFTAIGVGWNRAWGSLGANLKGLGKIFRGDADVRKSLKGPVGLAGLYTRADFWALTAMLSMWLALVNILPIPALDGGHLVFLAIEAIKGSEPSLKARMVAQQIGMGALLLLMALIIFNDFLNL